MPTLPPGPPTLTPAQSTARALAAALAALGADLEVTTGVAVRHNLAGDEFVRIPALPMPVAVRILRTLTGDAR